MCLLVIAWQAHPRYRLVVAANRDEFHERPAAPMAKWPAPNDLLAGRDLRSGGTWLGLDRRRRFGVVTNFRDLQRPNANAPTRGELIPRFLSGEAAPGPFLGDLAPVANDYSGFNLLLSDTESLWYASNRAAGFARALTPGIYGLSNQFLDTPWPKLERVRGRFEAWLTQSAGGAGKSGPQPAPEASAEATEVLFAILNDRSRVSADAELPQTGLSPEWERVLSAPFVLNPDYGTRCSTVVLIEAGGAATIAERRFDREGQVTGNSHWTLNAGEWPSQAAQP
ncbi:MAG TPA: NRDE family protein [Steroidobacteraceae bacterium]|jgi:uncharacterized protein with NRDE domain